MPVSREPSEPALSHRLHLCADLGGHGVHRISHQRLRPPDRWSRITWRLPIELSLDTLEMALRVKDHADEEVIGVIIQHSGAGLQCAPLRYTDRFAEVGAVAPRWDLSGRTATSVLP